MASLITLCNQALAEIAKGQVGSLAEASLEAREANRFAEPLLAEMAEWSDAIPLSRRTVALAEIVNDRPAEWVHAYAAPSDMAVPLAIRETEDDIAALPSTRPYSLPVQDSFPLTFAFEGGVIYSNIDAARIHYTSSSLTADDLSPLMQRAFVLELAARLAGPLAKDAKLVQAKGQQARIARLEAIAHEEAKNPLPRPRYVSEAEYARNGIGV